MGTPIVLERSKAKKKGKKPANKDADRFERNIYKATRRTADAADRGLQRYKKARDKSARKERDGAIIELLPNMARGMTTAAGRLTPVPLDLVRATWPGSVRRTTRRSVRAAVRMFEGS